MNNRCDGVCLQRIYNSNMIVDVMIYKWLKYIRTCNNLSILRRCDEAFFHTCDVSIELSSSQSPNDQAINGIVIFFQSVLDVTKHLFNTCSVLVILSMSMNSKLFIHIPNSNTFWISRFDVRLSQILEYLWNSNMFRMNHSCDGTYL